MKPLLWFTGVLFAAACVWSMYEIHLQEQAKRQITIYAPPSPWGAAMVQMAPHAEGCIGVWWKNVNTGRIAHTDDCLPPRGEGVVGEFTADGRVVGAVQ